MLASTTSPDAVSAIGAKDILGPLRGVTGNDWVDGVRLGRSLVRWINQVCAASAKTSSNADENGATSALVFARRRPNDLLRMLLTALSEVCQHLDTVHDRLGSAEIFRIEHLRTETGTENLWAQLCSALVVVFAPASALVFNVDVRLNGLRTLQVYQQQASLFVQPGHVNSLSLSHTHLHVLAHAHTHTHTRIYMSWCFAADVGV